MRFNRLQVILMFLCLIALGFSIGFLVKGSPTVMPFLFLLFLVILGITFIPGTSWTHVRNGVRIATPRVYNFWTMISRNARSICQSIWTGVKRGAAHVSPHVKSFFSTIGTDIKAFFASTRNTMQQAPSKWCGIGCMLIATLLFIHAYMNASYGTTFHFGLFATFSAALFFINHHGWDKAYDFVTEKKNGVGLLASLAWLALAYEHNWSLLWPGIFTALATIVFFDWTQSIKGVMVAGAGYIWKRVLKLLTGGYGWGISCLVYAAIIFVYAAQIFQRPGLLTGKDLDLAYNLAMIIVILIILAPILIGEKVFKKKKGETDKK